MASCKQKIKKKTDIGRYHFWKVGVGKYQISSPKIQCQTSLMATFKKYIFYCFNKSLLICLFPPQEYNISAHQTSRNQPSSSSSVSSARPLWSTARPGFERWPCASSCLCTGSTERPCSASSHPVTPQSASSSCIKPSLKALQRSTESWWKPRQVSYCCSH